MSGTRERGWFVLRCENRLCTSRGLRWPWGVDEPEDMRRCPTCERVGRIVELPRRSKPSVGSAR